MPTRDWTPLHRIVDHPTGPRFHQCRTHEVPLHIPTYGAPGRSRSPSRPYLVPLPAPKDDVVLVIPEIDGQVVPEIPSRKSAAA